MGKGDGPAVDSEAVTLRSIPSVDRILNTPVFVTLASEFGREAVKEAVAAYLSEIRQARSPYVEGEALSIAGERLALSTSTTLERVINATGVIIHTNLGRSPISPAVWNAAGSVTSGYSNLEFDLDAGDRGKRDEHLTALCQTLFGCEDAVLTNNNAAATLLLLAAVAPKKEVVVSRGELVEIGGSFRVPDVIQQGGAKLREVGTTNRTRAGDYAAVITKKTAAVLRVHRSNFDMVGFTETPTVEELVDVARSKRVPMLYDEGSGRVIDISPYGFSRGDTIRELIAKGVHAVTCSTDKLIGATQGGLILGGTDIVAMCRRHPLMRALRAGKESYAIIGATLRAFATGKHEAAIPIYRMLASTIDELRARGEELIRGTRCQLIDSRCALGGGTTPAETIASVSVAVPGNAADLHERFRSMDPPIVGRVNEDRFTLDLRTILTEDLAATANALKTSG